MYLTCVHYLGGPEQKEAYLGYLCPEVLASWAPLTLWPPGESVSLLELLQAQTSLRCGVPSHLLAFVWHHLHGDVGYPCSLPAARLCCTGDTGVAPTGVTCRFLHTPEEGQVLCPVSGLFLLQFTASFSSGTCWVPLAGLSFQARGFLWSCWSQLFHIVSGIWGLHLAEICRGFYS